MIGTILLFVSAAGGCASLPKDFDKPQSFAYKDTDNTFLGRVFNRDSKRDGSSGFLLLPDGLDAYVARAVLAEKAERSIDVQYYLYHGDLVGRLFTNELVKAADRGVRVRLLVDDMDLAGRDLAAAVLESHPNMEVRVFNPFNRNEQRATQFVTRFGSVTRRMHNKAFIVDNQAAILGGRNIGNEYFEADPGLAFSDLDVLVIGEAVKEVSNQFDLYWNSELSYPATVLKGKPPTAKEITKKERAFKDFIAGQTDSPYQRALLNSRLAKLLLRGQIPDFKWGNARVVYDRPEKILHEVGEKQYHLAPQLAPFVNGLRKELIIFSAYFVPGKEGTELLSELCRRGVRVRILTNSLASNDVSVVHAGYSRYRKDLLRAGVELYEMNETLTKEQRKEKEGVGGSSKASLHTKSFVFDRQHVFIGSFNLDPRSVGQNTEIGVVFDQA
ncbi:MAG TPA: phospholipase D family protein, partial [Nitrospiria bacterium]|nr:phospholipase D family protein [Nitrospiria bacterium]